MFKPLLEGFCDLVYPPNCFLCKTFLPDRSPTDFLCPTCFNAVEFNHPPFCLKCSRPIDPDSSGQICTTCRIHKPYFDIAWGCCLYNDSLQGLIHAYKYGQKIFLRYPLSRWMGTFAQYYRLPLEAFDLVVPVPLSSTRLRERGYNQSQLLAQELVKSLGLPLEFNNVIRTRNTQFQARLSEKERWTNIEGAFKIKHPKKFDGKNVLIVDDLLTTGATASEIARILKESGAQKVGVLTLAIA